MLDAPIPGPPRTPVLHSVHHPTPAMHTCASTAQYSRKRYCWHDTPRRQLPQAAGHWLPERCSRLRCCVPTTVGEGQGYYFGRPVVAEEFAELLGAPLRPRLASRPVSALGAPIKARRGSVKPDIFLLRAW